MDRTAERRLPMAALISASLFAIGISLASTTPYDAIVAIEALKISHGDFALILTAASIVGLIASVALGWLSDHVGDRRLLLVATALIGATGFGLMYLLRSPFAFVIAYCVIFPFGNAAFSQTFAYARVYFDQHHRPKDAEFRITLLRSIYAGSWVLVPPLAGWIAATYQIFDIYLLAAAAYLGCGAISLVLLASPVARIAKPADEAAAVVENHIALPILIGIAGILLINVSLRLSGTIMPLAVVSNFGGNVGDVGLVNGVRALLEVPLMLLWGVVGRRFRKHTLIAAGALIYGLYLVLMARATSVVEVFWLQVPCAIAIASLLTVPISYMQEAIRGRVGLSTSLLDVVFVASGMLSAGLFGWLAAPNSYLHLFWVAGGVAVAGGAIVVAAHTIFDRSEPVAAE